MDHLVKEFYYFNSRRSFTSTAKTTKQARIVSKKPSNMSIFTKKSTTITETKLNKKVQKTSFSSKKTKCQVTQDVNLR